MKFCSACLLGINCRYDGQIIPNDKVIELAKREILIPVCPEQLGGLSTPREPAEQKGNKVVTKLGTNVTRNFTEGAKQVLKLGKLFGIKEYWDTYKNVSDFIFNKVINHSTGEWWPLLTREGEAIWHHMGNSWKTNYHT